MSDIATQITTLRGGRFDRKYFQRLFDGTLGDGAVNDLVEWITDRFDRSFKDSLFSFGSSRDGAILRLWAAPPNYKEDWHVPVPKLLAAVHRSIQLRGSLKNYSQERYITVRYRYISFLDNSRLIHSSDLDPLTTFSEYFLEYQGSIFPFHSGIGYISRISENINTTFEQSSIVDLAFFLMKYVEGYSPTLILSPQNLISTISQLQEGEAFNTEFVMNIYEPPQLYFSDDVISANFQFDAIINFSYMRVEFFFEESIFKYSFLFSRKIDDVRIIPSEKEYAYFYTDAMVETPKIDINRLMEFISLSESGELISRIVRSGLVSISLIDAPQEYVSYNRKSREINVGVSPRAERNLFALAARIVYAMYQATTDLAGVTRPLEDDISEFSGWFHGFSLDSIIYTCEFVDEIGPESPEFGAVYEFIRENNLDKFFKKWKNGASIETLYLEYVNVYDLYIRSEGV
jgi:hypothetical protein